MLRTIAYMLIAVVFMAELASARPVEILTQEQLAARSDAIVVARLVKCRTVFGIEHKLAEVYIAREAHFDVRAILKGKVTNEQIVFAHLGLAPRKEQVKQIGKGIQLYVIDNKMVVNGYDLASFPDLPTAKNNDAEDAPLSAAKQELREFVEAERLYLLYLKQRDDGKYEGTTGYDSALSVFELKRASQP